MRQSYALVLLASVLAISPASTVADNRSKAPPRGRSATSAAGATSTAATASAPAIKPLLVTRD